MQSPIAWKPPYIEISPWFALVLWLALNFSGGLLGAWLMRWLGLG